KRRRLPVLRCKHLPRTERPRPAPLASNSALSAFPPHSRNSHTPYPCSRRSSIRRDASRANGSETPPPRFVRCLQTATVQPLFLPLSAAISAAAQWIRSSCFRLSQFQFLRKLRILVVTVQWIAP